MVDELDDDLPQDIDRKLPASSRIAPPGISSSMPAVTLRGLNIPATAAASPSPTTSADAAPPATGSIGDLEQKGLESHLAPRPIAKPSALETRTAQDEAKMADLQKGSGISQIAKAHPVGGGILRGLNTVGSIAEHVAPILGGVMTAIPGTEEHHNYLVRQQTGRLGEDQAEAAKDAATEKEEADTEEANARTGLTEQQTKDLQNPQPKPKEEKWDEFKDYTDTDGTPLMREENSGAVVRSDNKKPPQGFKLAVTKPENPNDFEQFYSDFLKDNNFPDTAHNRLLARKQYAAASQSPPREPKQLAVDPDGNVIELKVGAKVKPGTKTVTGDLATPKPTADEQRRSDLAENLDENFNQLEDILKRRPDLFGPVAGRWTSLKQMLGSNDPDVAALATIQHQVGMAQISAHGMRSAQGVAEAADSILNSFKNGPDAVKGALDAARKSVTTFQKDVENAKHPEKAKAASEPASSENDPLGIR